MELFFFSLIEKKEEEEEDGKLSSNERWKECGWDKISKSSFSED